MLLIRHQLVAGPLLTFLLDNLYLEGMLAERQFEAPARIDLSAVRAGRAVVGEEERRLGASLDLDQYRLDRLAASQRR